MDALEIAEIFMRDVFETQHGVVGIVRAAVAHLDRFFVDPFFLQGKSEADKKNIGRDGVYFIYYLFVFASFFVKIPVMRIYDGKFRVSSF